MFILLQLFISFSVLNSFIINTKYPTILTNLNLNNPLNQPSYTGVVLSDTETSNQSPNGNYYIIGGYLGPNNDLTNEFFLLIDTGYPYTWIPSINYTSNEDQEEELGFNIAYNCSTSLTCSMIKDNEGYIGYAGAINGSLVKDKLWLTGDNEGNFQPYIPLILVDKIDQSIVRQQEYVYFSSGFPKKQGFSTLDYPTYSGVLGLGLSNSTCNSTFLNTLVNDNLISSPWFILYFEANPYTVIQSVTVLFQDIDPTLTTIPNFTQDQFTIINLTNQSTTWSINIDACYYGSTPILLGNGNQTQALLASGSQFLVLPKNDYYNFIKALGLTQYIANETGIYTECPSGSLNLYSNITINTGGNNLTIPIWSYVIYHPWTYYNEEYYTKSEFLDSREQSNKESKITDDDIIITNQSPYGAYLGPFYPYNNGWSVGFGDVCQLLITTYDFVNTSYNIKYYYNTWILGIPFLQNYLTLFNQSDQTIGFAPASQPNLAYFNRKNASNNRSFDMSLIVCLLMSLSVIVIIICSFLIMTRTKKVKHVDNISKIEESPQVSVKDITPTESFQNPDLIVSSRVDKKLRKQLLPNKKKKLNLVTVVKTTMAFRNMAKESKLHHKDDEKVNNNNEESEDQNPYIKLEDSNEVDDSQGTTDDNKNYNIEK